MNTFYVYCLIFAIFEAHLAFVFGKALLITNDLNDDERSCVVELNLNEEKIKQQNNEDLAPEEDADFTKFLNCYWVKMGWRTENGDIKWDILKEDLIRVALEQIKDESPSIKIMVNLLLNTAFSDCYLNPPKGITPENGPIKYQNCLMTKLTEFANSE